MTQIKHQDRKILELAAKEPCKTICIDDVVKAMPITRGEAGYRLRKLLHGGYFDRGPKHYGWEKNPGIFHLTSAGREAIK